MTSLATVTSGSRESLSSIVEFEPINRISRGLLGVNLAFSELLSLERRSHRKSMDASMFASLGVIREANKSIFRESPASSRRAKSLKAA